MRERVIGCAIVAAFLIGALRLPSAPSPVAEIGVQSAHAQDTPIVLAEAGDQPDVAVDADGTAHFVWNEDEVDVDEPDRTYYCQVPRGATACAVSHVFSPDPRVSDAGSEDSHGPLVFLPGGGQVVVFTHRCCGAFPPAGNEGLHAVVSDDGGQTFGPPRVIGDLQPSGDAVLGPDGRAYVVTDAVTGGTFFQAAPLDGFAEDVVPLGEGGQGFGGAVALVDGTTPIVAFQDLGDPHMTWYRLSSGTGDLNDAASWGPTTAVGPGDKPRLAGGPGGVWLLYTTGEVGHDQLVLRRFEETGFGDPIPVSGSDPDPVFADLAQDGEGRLHVVWMGSPRRLVYGVVTADGASEVRDLTDPGDPVWDPHVAAAQDGGGWVVWKGSDGNDGEIVALPVGLSTDGQAQDTAAQATESVDLQATNDAPSTQVAVPTATGAQDDPDDFDDLQATAEAHETAIANLTATSGAHADALEAQETAIASLEATVAAHADEVEAQQTEIADLEATVAAQQADLADIQATVAAQQAEVAGLVAQGSEDATEVPQATPETDGLATPGTDVVLYEADTTGGLDQWTGSVDWLHRDGMLVNDGSLGYSLIVAPFQPGGISLSDYVVEAEIRVIRCDTVPTQRQGFGLAARVGERGGYWGGMNLCLSGDRAVIWAADPEVDEFDNLNSEEFRSDSEWHTYRLEVRGDVIRLLIDGEPVVETMDLRYVDGGQVGLWSIVTQIEVRSFRVLALS